MSSLAAALPSLGSILIVGWVMGPLFVPNCVPYLVILSMFFAWTKLTETIVSKRGSLPSIVHCYYKAFHCCRRSVIDHNEAVPKISAEAADVVFSAQNMFDSDGVAARCAIAEFDAHREANRLALSTLSTEEEASLGDASSPSATAPPSSSHSPASSSLSSAPASPSAAPRGVAAPRRTPQLERMFQVMRSAQWNLHPAFLYTPVFNMELSVMTFAYFPLSAWSADLLRSDLLFLRPTHRKAPFSFSTRILTHREVGSDVEVDFVTLVSAKVAATTAAPSTTSAVPRRGPAPSASAKSRQVPVARVQNTYLFRNCVRGENLTLPMASSFSSSPLASILSTHLSSSPSASTVTTLYAVGPETAQSFATSSGNIHPKHLSPSIARCFGALGRSIPPSAPASLDSPLSAASASASSPSAFGNVLHGLWVVSAVTDAVTAADVGTVDRKGDDGAALTEQEKARVRASLLHQPFRLYTEFLRPLHVPAVSSFSLTLDNCNSATSFSNSSSVSSSASAPISASTPTDAGEVKEKADEAKEDEGEDAVTRAMEAEFSRGQSTLVPSLTFQFRRAPSSSSTSSFSSPLLVRGMVLR